MKKEIEINDELISRYLAGEALPEEAMTLDAWLEEPANRLHFDKIQHTWIQTYPTKAPKKVNVESAWNTLKIPKRGLHQPKEHTRMIGKNFFKIAAAVVLIATVTWLIYYSLQNQKHAELVSETRDSVRLIVFPDHSKVMLNRNSTLKYPARFIDQRQVFLIKGEAFFNIEPDITKPFIIGTEIATIKVLGTAFNVVVSNDSVQVSVDQGKVLVFTLNDSVYLEAGMAATAMKAKPSFTIYESNSNVWAYATHRLVFQNTPLWNVFNYIEKAQNCSINIVDPDIANCKLSATFEGVSTDYMLNLIAEALNLSVIKNDSHTFTVAGEGCH